MIMPKLCPLGEISLTFTVHLVTQMQLEYLWLLRRLLSEEVLSRLESLWFTVFMIFLEQIKKEQGRGHIKLENLLPKWKQRELTCSICVLNYSKNVFQSLNFTFVLHRLPHCLVKTNRADLVWLLAFELRLCSSQNFYVYQKPERETYQQQNSSTCSLVTAAKPSFHY